MDQPFMLHPNEFIVTSRANEMRNIYPGYRWLVFEEMLDMVQQGGFRVLNQREEIFRPEMLPVYVVCLVPQFAP